MTTGDGSGSMAASGWIIGLVIMLLLIAVIIVIAAFVKKRQSKHVPNNPWITNGEGSVRPRVLIGSGRNVTISCT